MDHHGIITPMPFIPFAMLISVMMGRSIAGRWPQLAPENGILSTFAIVAIAGAMARFSMAYAAAIFDTTGSSSQAFRTAHQSRQIFQWLWILTSPLLLAVTGWGATVQLMLRGLGVGDNALFGIAAWIIPSILFVSILDIAWFEFEKHVRQSVAPQQPMDSGLGFWWNQFKHTWLLVLIPTFLVCGLIDLVEPLHLNEWSMPARVLLYSIAIPLGVVALPEILVFTWRAKAMSEGATRDRLEEVWTSLQVPSTSILSWSSNLRVCNAMVVGFLPWRRKLMVSDLMLKSLPMPQIEMILCHEAAHIHRGHLYLRAIPFGLSLLSLLGLRLVYESNLTLQDWVDSQPMIIGLLAIAKLTVVLWMSSRIARWTEKDADRIAVVLAKRYGLGSADHASPESNLISALQAASKGSNRKRSSWLYPSIQERCQAIQEIAT